MSSDGVRGLGSAASERPQRGEALPRGRLPSERRSFHELPSLGEVAGFGWNPAIPCTGQGLRLISSFLTTFLLS